MSSTSEGKTDQRTDVAEVELGIVGDRVIPARISELVGVASSRGWTKGDQSFSRSGQVIPRHSGLWALGCRDICVPDAADSLLKLLAPHAARLRTAAREAEGTISVSVWWDPAARQGGFTLSSETLKRLAELGDRIDFYFPG